MIIYTNLFALSREFVPLSAFLIQEFQLPLLIAPVKILALFRRLAYGVFYPGLPVHLIWMKAAVS
jgi:hypothetical protein